MLGQRRRRWVNIEPTHGQCETRDIAYVLVVLAHRLRRWPNIEPTHGQCPVFAGPLLKRIYQRCRACTCMAHGL